MVTFITPTQGNTIALKRTLESVKNICDEFIIGSVCVFGEDIQKINEYSQDYNMRIIKLPFSYIFHMGFSSTLNLLASHATNDLVLYLNVGEVISKGEEKILSTISDQYNCYYLDHPVETHRWYRLYNRKELEWNGIIHEEIQPIKSDYKPYHKPIFTFEDTDKDSQSPIKAAAYNELKELTYFNLYKQIVDYPKRLSITNEWWLNFAKENYESMAERLAQKGKRYEAIQKGDLQMFLNDIYNNSEFEKQRFDSNEFIEFQGSTKSL